MEKTTTPSFQNKIQNILMKSSPVITVIVLVIIVAIIASVIVIAVGNKAAEKEAASLYSLEQDFTEWYNQDTDLRIIDDIIPVLEEYSFKNGGYADIRQQIYIAAAYEAVEDYETAVGYYAKAAGSTGYLGELAMLKQGLLLEATGDISGARQVLIDLAEGYDFVDEARVLFSIGRLSEALAETDTALQYYNQVVAEYASNGWANLAQDRIIAINAAAN